MNWTRYIVLVTVCFVLSCDGDRSFNNKDTLRIAISIEPESINPLRITSADMVAVFDNVFDALVGYNSQGEILPHLASKWQVFNESRRYVFNLRDDVFFHNNMPLTAHDVLHTYDTYMRYSARFSLIDSINVLDDSTIEFILKQADNDFINLVAMTWIFSQSEGENPISGTGAYQFCRYDSGRRLYFTRFEGSFHQYNQPVFFKNIEFIIIKESVSALMGLESGSIDMITQFDPTSISKAVRQKFQVIHTPQNLINLMAFNNKSVPFTDINVRRAINYAVDKDLLIRLLVSGEGLRLDTGMSPMLSLFYNHDLDNFYPYDPEKAQELLLASGYTETNPLTFTVRVPSNYSMHMRTAEIIALQLAQLSITMHIEPLEWATWLSEVYRGKEYQATIIGLTGKLSPYQQLNRFSVLSQTNFTNFFNDAFEETLYQAITAQSEEEEYDAYSQAQFILTREANSLFLLDPYLAVITRKDIVGWQAYPIHTFRVREYTLS